MRSEYKSYLCVLIAYMFTTFSLGLLHDNLFIFLLPCTSGFANSMTQLTPVASSRNHFLGDQNVILFLEIRRGSLKPPNDNLLKDGLVVSHVSHMGEVWLESCVIDSIYMSVLDGGQGLLARKGVCLPPLQPSLALQTTRANPGDIQEFYWQSKFIWNCI